MARKAKPMTVADVARRTGVSTRTLQYYDDIGLLKADRSAKDYRLYGSEHLLRLQQILIGRSFGQSLEDIRRSLDDPQFDQIASLKAQRSRLQDRAKEARDMIASIDASLAFLAANKEIDMKTDDMFRSFDPEKYEQEAEQRWGDTPQWQDSRRRMKSYGKADWDAIKAETSAFYRAAAEAMRAGEAADSDTARSLVSQNREHVERWFYAVSPEMHRNLADFWQSDDRFRHNIDKYGEGLTDWLAGWLAG